MVTGKNLLIILAVGLCIIASISLIILNTDSDNNDSAAATGCFNGLTEDDHTFKILKGSGGAPDKEGTLSSPGNYSLAVSNTDGGKNDLEAATGYFNGLTVDGHIFKILKSGGDIPYREGNLRSPGNYSRFIGPPVTEKWPVKPYGDRVDSVRLYTWSDMDGLLIRWDVGISNGSVVRVNANLMDVGVGNYEVNNTSRYIPALGVDVTGATAKGIFTRYGDIFKSRGGQFDFKLSAIHGRFFEWDYQDYSNLAIYEVDGPMWYPLEPGYIHDDDAIRTVDVWRHNVTAWGYYTNNSTFFSGLPADLRYPGYNGPGPVKAFYISYYSLEG